MDVDAGRDCNALGCFFDCSLSLSLHLFCGIYEKKHWEIFTDGWKSQKIMAYPLILYRAPLCSDFMGVICVVTESVDSLYEGEVHSQNIMEPKVIKLESEVLS